MISQLFSYWQDCPVCHARESIEIPTEAATFFRCRNCQEAIKQLPDGRLVRWMDYTRAGTGLPKGNGR